MVHIEYGADETGDIMVPINQGAFLEKTRTKCHIFTADGGFDFSIDFNKQEENSLKLIFCEICFAMMLQKKGGSFVIKMYDLYSSGSLQLLYLLNYLYEEVHVAKPLTSRPANSEKYIVCMKFKIVPNLDELLEKCITNYDKFSITNILSVPLSNHFIEKMIEVNSIFGQNQVENIVSILNYIMDETKHEKNDQIKKTHLSKCVKLCKKYNLPIYDHYN
jgi:hypothetical protein